MIKNLCLNYAFGANPSLFSWKLAFKPSVTLGLCGMALLVLIHDFGQESSAVVKSVGSGVAAGVAGRCGACVGTGETRCQVEGGEPHSQNMGVSSTHKKGTIASLIWEVPAHVMPFWNFPLYWLFQYFSLCSLDMAND